MPKFPVDAPKQRVVKTLENLGMGSGLEGMGSGLGNYILKEVREENIRAKS
jgi:hypothetical protein